MPTSQLKSYQQMTNTATIPVTDVLLDNVTGNTDGSWKFCGVETTTLVTVEAVNGAFTGTVTIYGSTQPAPPADSDNTRVQLMQVTATDSFSVPQGYRWIKARVTGYGGGTIFAGLVASSR